MGAENGVICLRFEPAIFCVQCRRYTTLPLVVCVCKDESTAACVCVCVCVSVCTPLLSPYNQHVHHNYIHPFVVKTRSPGPLVRTDSTKYPNDVFPWVFEQRPLQRRQRGTHYE